KAILGSSFHAPRSRASSSTRPARVTAGLGSSRKAPGCAHRTGGPGRVTRVEGRGKTVSRRAVVARAGDHSTASLSSRRSASSSTSQPGGTRPRGRPGAVLIPTPATWSPRPRHQDRGGRAPGGGGPGGAARPARRGDNTPARGRGRVDGIEVDGRGVAPRGEGTKVAADAAAQVGHPVEPNVPARPVPSKGLGRGLLQPLAGEPHLPRQGEPG